MRSAWRCAAWCFHSRTWASGVPSARVGSGELAVKSVAMPRTSPGSMSAAATAAGTATRSAST